MDKKDSNGEKKMVQIYLVLHFCSDAEIRMLVVYNHPVTKCEFDILLLKNVFVSIFPLNFLFATQRFILGLKLIFLIWGQNETF